MSFALDKPARTFLVLIKRRMVILLQYVIDRASGAYQMYFFFLFYLNKRYELKIIRRIL